MSFKELEGKIINCIFVNINKDILKFETDQGVLMYAAHGDCCNHVWFEHFSGIEAVGGEVLSVEAKGWREIGNGLDDVNGVLDSGFWTIKTSRGYIDIEVRNSHNGYYGGNVELYERALSEREVFKIVTDDF